MAGVNYPAYYNQQAQNTSVIINGQEVTLATAKNPAERAAVEAQIRAGYLKRYVGINPDPTEQVHVPSDEVA